MTKFHFSPRPNRAGEIHWQEWDEAAFSEAQRQDKPILLDIGAVWCHWCHVMDETSYSDPGIIHMVNDRFIAIRVDNDQRPDVNRRYNLGGWPTTAFLTPGGELLTGGTYIAPQQMRSYLLQVSEAYRQDKQHLLDRLREVEQRRQAGLDARPGGTGALSDEITQNVAREVLDHFDSAYGGFGTEPKFPQTDALELALAEYQVTRSEAFLPVATVTLTNMSRGGVYDEVAGGFFRYSTTRDWSVPHFEKMLEDNARLLEVLLHAYQVTGRALFRDTARSLIEYVRTTLHDPERGYFYGSQDADEHYYALPAEERAKLAAPFIDRNFYTDWNALMASALLLASRVLDEPELQKTALHPLAMIGEEMFTPDAGLFHYRKAGEEQPQLPGLLGDLAYTAQAFLDAFQVTGRRTYLSRVQLLARWAMDHLLDRDRGAFLSEPPRPDAPGLLRLPDISLAENATLANVLIDLHYLTGEQEYRDVAGRALAFFIPDYPRYSYNASIYALAVRRFLSYPVMVTVVGSEGDSRALELVDAAVREYLPHKIVELLDPEKNPERLLALGYPGAGPGARAYICVDQTCLAPVTEPRQVSEAMATIGKPQPGSTL
ncbi:MAG: thioredoxin domain-containing protein [Rudaea sp.]